MVQQEKSICPECGVAPKIGQKFCTFCGAKLSEVNATEPTSGAPPPLLTTDDNYFPIKGWEVSYDRTNMYLLMMANLPIGNPIIASKCRLGGTKGFLIVSDNGFAWRFKWSILNPEHGYCNVWIRWHDVAIIIPKKKGQVLVVIKKRKKGSLKFNRKGLYIIY